MAVDTSGPGYLAGEYPGGITTVEGAPQAATVNAYYELPSGDWQLAASVTSSSSGAWQILNVNPDFLFHVLGRKSGYNDVLVSGVHPTRTDVVTATGSFSPNAGFNGVAGSVELVGGLPPYSASVITPLPFGLAPVLNGRELIIDGTSTDDGNWSSLVRVTASNGPTVDIPVNTLIGLKAPTNLKAAYAVANDWEVSLSWTDTCGLEQGFRIYRSTSPMDASALPAPLATVGANVTAYVDSGLTPGQTYYYRVASYYASSSAVSAEVAREVKWTPAMLTGKYVWLDASSLTPSWGGQLLDKGPLGHHYSQAAASRIPTLSTVNGLQALSFDGTNDQLLSNNAARSIMRNVGAGWAMAVYKLENAGGTHRVVLSVPMGAGEGSVVRFAATACTTRSSDGRPEIYGRRLDTDSPPTPYLVAANGTSGAWVIAGFFRQFSTGQASVWLDGAQSASASMGTPGKTSNTDGVHYLGLGATPYSYSLNGADFEGPFQGAIAEVIYGAGDQIPDAATQARLEGYLAHKWGLVGSLPSTHPYKTTAP